MATKENNVINEQSITVEFGGKTYYMLFDMQSFKTYKAFTGNSFLKDIEKLLDMDDEVVLGVLAATLRNKKGDEPLGESIYEIDELPGIIVALRFQAVTVVSVCMPKSEENVKKKVTKRTSRN